MFDNSICVSKPKKRSIIADPINFYYGRVDAPCQHQVKSIRLCIQKRCGFFFFFENIYSFSVRSVISMLSQCFGCDWAETSHTHTYKIHTNFEAHIDSIHIVDLFKGILFFWLICTVKHVMHKWKYFMVIDIFECETLLIRLLFCCCYIIAVVHVLFSYEIHQYETSTYTDECVHVSMIRSVWNLDVGKCIPCLI